jgi:hypothetical protein
MNCVVEHKDLNRAHSGLRALIRTQFGCRLKVKLAEKSSELDALIGTISCCLCRMVHYET